MQEKTIEQLLDRHGDRLYRLCLVMLANQADAEDAVQETIVKYLQKKPSFTDTEHEKAWLLKVAANKCRDTLRFRARHPQVPLDTLQLTQEPEASGILDALMQLPKPFRVVLVLHYVEEYPVKEIADMIGRTPSAVKMRLQKGRRLLEERYRKEYME